MGELVLSWEKSDFSWYIPRMIQRRHNATCSRRDDLFETFRYYYPHLVYIHEDLISEYSNHRNLNLRRDIRRWVVHNVHDECMVYQLKKNFKYLPEHKAAKLYYSYDDYIGVAHGYWVFFFNQVSEAVNFKLCFSDVVSEYSPVPDYCSHIPPERIIYNMDSYNPAPGDTIITIDE